MVVVMGVFVTGGSSDSVNGGGGNIGLSDFGEDGEEVGGLLVG